MHLASYDSAKRHFDQFRDLTAQELEEHSRLSPHFLEARERLSLFRILHRNYLDWRGYLDRLLSSDFKEDVEASEELNRFLLNYLTAAYTIQEHFTASYRQRVKKLQAEQGKYDDYLDRLCKHSWAFAFFLDYRNYVQHVGFGITRSNRHRSDTAVTIEVVAEAASLIKDSPRNWKRSALQHSHGEINIVATLKDFHIDMFESYAKFVAKTP